MDPAGSPAAWVGPQPAVPGYEGKDRSVPQFPHPQNGDHDHASLIGSG